MSAFCWPTTQTTSITNSLVAIVHRKPVITNCVPKLVAMATSLSTSGLPSNTCFLGPIRAHNPNDISIGSTVFAGLSVCPVLSSLSCLYVTLVYCGQTDRRTKMKIGTLVGRRSGHIVLDGDPAPPPQRDRAPTNFRLISVVA